MGGWEEGVKKEGVRHRVHPGGWGVALAVTAASESRAAASRISRSQARITGKAGRWGLCVQAGEGHLSPSENSGKTES